MPDLIVPNIYFQTQKKLSTVNNIGVLVKSVLTDLRAHNFVHVKISLCAHCVHARHHAPNLLSPDSSQFTLILAVVRKHSILACQETNPWFISSFQHMCICFHFSTDYNNTHDHKYIHLFCAVVTICHWTQQLNIHYMSCLSVLCIF